MDARKIVPMGLGFWAYGFNSVFLLFFLRLIKKKMGCAESMKTTPSK